MADLREGRQVGELRRPHDGVIDRCRDHEHVVVK
jgi:hypothetical protein